MLILQRCRLRLYHSTILSHYACIRFLGFSQQANGLSKPSGAAGINNCENMPFTVKEGLQVTIVLPCRLKHNQSACYIFKPFIKGLKISRIIPKIFTYINRMNMNVYAIRNNKIPFNVILESITVLCDKKRFKGWTTDTLNKISVKNLLSS